MLRIKNLSFKLDSDRLILDQINSVFQPNEVYGIAGKSGAGKSTLLNFLFGCDFGTSEGRCTKGVYGTYFKFSNMNIPNCDGIFLIDT